MFIFSFSLNEDRSLSLLLYLFYLSMCKQTTELFKKVQVVSLQLQPVAFSWMDRFQRQNLLAAKTLWHARASF